MQRIIDINSSTIETIKASLIEYAGKFDLALLLDSNSHVFSAENHSLSDYDLIAGFANDTQESQQITSYQQLHNIDQSLNHWYLGYLTYDLKNQLENLTSANTDYLNWPPILFFRPSVLILIRNDKLEVLSDDKHVVTDNFINKLLSSKPDSQSIQYFTLKPRITKNEYILNAEKIMNHIKRGDIYEINYCQEFYDYSSVNPYSTYLSINRNCPSPFSAFLKVHDRFLLSASPERFLKKEGSRIISQPMKGTAQRSRHKNKDKFYRNYLQTSRKERAENIMITDLVRNDLSKIALKNSVLVDELCGIYAFPQVYQMISTISAKLRPVTFAEIIKAAFPMGSMTGAPKIRAMELIEKYETAKRGLYSGAVGYIAPGMDFDFNVVIRSLQYNEEINYLSYMTGSALTSLSDPEREYEECLLKSYAINSVTQSTEYA